MRNLFECSFMFQAFCFLWFHKTSSAYHSRRYVSMMAKGFGSPNKGTKVQQGYISHYLDMNPRAALSITVQKHLSSINTSFPNLSPVHGDPPVFEVVECRTQSIPDSPRHTIFPTPFNRSKMSSAASSVSLILIEHRL